MSFKFMNKEHDTFESNGTYYVVLKDLIEGVGMDWKSWKKRKLDEDLIDALGLIQMSVVRPAEEAGGAELTPQGRPDTWCIPRSSIHGLFMTISLHRNMLPENRERIRSYRKECVEALDSYWEYGVAYNTNFGKKTWSSFDSTMSDGKKFLAYASRDMGVNFLDITNHLRPGTTMYQAVAHICLILGRDIPSQKDAHFRQVFHRMKGSSAEAILDEMLK